MMLLATYVFEVRRIFAKNNFVDFIGSLFVFIQSHHIRLDIFLPCFTSYIQKYRFLQTRMNIYTFHKNI